MRGRMGIATVLAWVFTRLYLCSQLLGPKAFYYTGDVDLYRGWASMLAAGHFPVDDVRWQYPPAAAMIMVLPRLLPGPYLLWFVAMALVADATVVAVLLRAARRGGSRLGAWYWIAGTTLLGAVELGRFDLFPTLLAVAAVLLAGAPAAAGTLVGAGAALKVWPLALLTGIPARRWRPTWVAATVTGGALTLAWLAVSTDALGFLRGQGHRGLEFEAVAATPFMLGRAVGRWQGVPHYQYGSMELGGAHVGAATAACLVATVLAAGWFALWRWLLWRGGGAWSPATPADAALCATLVLVVTSRVLSPQYMIWLLGLAAACLASAGTTQRVPAALVLVASGLTFVEYRVLWFELVAGANLAVGTLALRNVLLVVALGWAAVALWRGTLGRAATAHDTPGTPRPTGDLVASGTAAGGAAGNS